MSGSEKMIKLTLTGSYSGCTERQRGTLRGLGLARRGRTSVLKSSDAVAGMIAKVAHLVKVEG